MPTLSIQESAHIRRRREYDFTARGNLNRPSNPIGIECHRGTNRFGKEEFHQRDVYASLADALLDATPTMAEKKIEIYLRKTGETIQVVE